MFKNLNNARHNSATHLDNSCRHVRDSRRDCNRISDGNCARGDGPSESVLHIRLDGRVGNVRVDNGDIGALESSAHVKMERS